MTEWEEHNFKDCIWTLLPTFNTDEEPLPISNERRDKIAEGIINQLTSLVYNVIDEKIEAAYKDLEFNQTNN